MRFRNYISLYLSMSLTIIALVRAHGYNFKYANDEIRDDIRIHIWPHKIQIHYQSLYLGQLAPHIRLMIDENNDTYISEAEMITFFHQYQNLLNERLKSTPLRLGNQDFIMQLESIHSPTLLSDSLLAPFGVVMDFGVKEVSLDTGKYELSIDPVLFFVNGNQFIQLAKEKVAFTDEQEKAIGRFIQIKVFGSSGVRFLSTYPGRLKNKGRMVYIFGVFYDKTLLLIKNNRYPRFKITFKMGFLE